MRKGLLFFAVLNMLVVAGALGYSLYARMAAGRYFVPGTVYVAPHLNESRLHFSAEDVEILGVMHPGFTFSAESRGSANLAATRRDTTAATVRTDMPYFIFLDFTEGNRWHGGAENVLVLNEALTFALFGTVENITGLSVMLGEESYTVAGVVRQYAHPTAWLPIEDLPARALYILPRQPNPLTANRARDMLAHNLGQDPAEYAIVDIDRYAQSIGIRVRIFLYLLWLIALLVLAHAAWRGLPRRPFSRRDIPFVLYIAGVGVCIFVLMGINDILLWLPNLSDPTASVFRDITTLGLLPDGALPYGLSRLRDLSRNTNIALIAGAVGLAYLLGNVTRQSARGYV